MPKSKATSASFTNARLHQASFDMWATDQSESKLMPDTFVEDAKPDPDPVLVRSAGILTQALTQKREGDRDANSGGDYYYSTFKPSPYQKAIFDFCLDPAGGDGMVDAVPGSGKSTTLIELAKRLPAGSSILMVAFNRHIAQELEPKLKLAGLHYRNNPRTGQRLVEAKTIHSIGYAALQKFLVSSSGGTGRLPLEESKYEVIIEKYIADLRLPNSVKISEYVYPIAKLLRFSQLTLTDPTDETALLNLALHYGITEVLPFWKTAVVALPLLLEEGRRVAQARNVINYDDMLYLPMALELTPTQTYDWVLVDEYQDINQAQLSFLLKLRAEGGGRFLFVGDYHQSIYGFSAADPAMKEVILARTGATVLPLSVCYRCPGSHVALAAEIYPEIEPAPNALVGRVSHEELDEDDVVSQVQKGDLIICRTTAPLIKMCFDLIKQGKQATVRGRDIGRSMKAVLTPLERSKYFECTAPNLRAYLDEYRDKQLELAKAKKAPPTTLEIIIDKVDAVWAVFEALALEDHAAAAAAAAGKGQGPGPARKTLQPKSVADIKKGIDRIFSDKGSHINLSTVHRAKGDEAKRVYILEPGQMPHPMAKQDWEVIQEWNCRYVALTRAKESLFLVKSSRPNHKSKSGGGATAKTAQNAHATPTCLSTESIGPVEQNIRVVGVSVRKYGYAALAPS